MSMDTKLAREFKIEREDDAEEAECMLREMADEVEQLKETNTRLNRRCQIAESGLEENIEMARRDGGSLGRALANAAATKWEHEVERLREEKGSLLHKAQMEITEAEFRVPQKWPAMLAAAKAYMVQVFAESEELVSAEDEQVDAFEVLREAIVACEEKP